MCIPDNAAYPERLDSNQCCHFINFWSPFMSGSIIFVLWIFSLTTLFAFKDFLLNISLNYYDYGEDNFGIQVIGGFWIFIGLGSFRFDSAKSGLLYDALP